MDVRWKKRPGKSYAQAWSPPPLEEDISRKPFAGDLRYLAELNCGRRAAMLSAKRQSFQDDHSRYQRTLGVDETQAISGGREVGWQSARSGTLHDDNHRGRDLLRN